MTSASFDSIEVQISYGIIVSMLDYQYHPKSVLPGSIPAPDKTFFFAIFKIYLNNNSVIFSIILAIHRRSIMH